MLVLVVNAGSSSLKSQLIETENMQVSMRCLAEKIGSDDASMAVSFAPDFEKHAFSVAGATVDQCLGKLLDVLTSNLNSPISELDQIEAIGNRIVAGGEYFKKATLVDDVAWEELLKCEVLAPLHNPSADKCIALMRELMPRTPQVTVFDTAFHQTMPPKAYMYPVPYKYYKEYAIRRYGAHGTSHRYAAQQVSELLGRPQSELGIITCHLGNGGSITAVDHGKSVDTTMGFTPLDGLMMGTRSGSLDPAIVTYLMQHENISPEKMNYILNHESGIAGIAGGISDMRNVRHSAVDGDEMCRLAIDMYVYRIQKAIGSYFAIMPVTNAIVMTAGIGENSPEIREQVFEGLEHLGMILDKERNKGKSSAGMSRIISTDDSPITICVVATDEEALIARETEALVNSL